MPEWARQLGMRLIAVAQAPPDGIDGECAVLSARLREWQVDTAGIIGVPVEEVQARLVSAFGASFVTPQIRLGLDRFQVYEKLRLEVASNGEATA